MYHLNNIALTQSSLKNRFENTNNYDTESINLKWIFISLLLLFPFVSSHAETSNLFVRPVFGISQLSDTDGLSQSVGSIDGPADVSVDGGFTAGLGVGYFLTNNVALELYWEYRSNDSETSLADGTVFTEGNYASNIFFANANYFFLPKRSQSSITPYLGAGLGWVQEIDIDLETDGQELSYSGDGDFTYQVFVGANYALSSALSLQAELRYQALSSVNLIAEEAGNGEFKDFDYSPLTAQIGLTYRF